MSYTSKAKDSFRTKKNLFLYDLASNNKNDFSKEDFNNYSIKKEMVDEYVTIYWQETIDFIIRNKTISQIEAEIFLLEKEKAVLLKICEEQYIKEIFPQIFPIEDLEKLLQTKKCFYCGITQEEILKLANRRKLRKKSLRGWSLEIDRLDSNYEYSQQNCQMCCYWCNNAKTDEFTPSEFKYIGQLIGNVWSARLANN